MITFGVLHHHAAFSEEQDPFKWDKESPTPPLTCDHFWGHIIVHPFLNNKILSSEIKSRGHIGFRKWQVASADSTYLSSREFSKIVKNKVKN